MAQTRPSPTLSRGFTRPGRFLAPYEVARRSADGRTKREIIRCLKRFLARELYQRVMTDFRMRQHGTEAA